MRAVVLCHYICHADSAGGGNTHSNTFFLFLGTSLLNVARICVVLLLVHLTQFLRCKRRVQAGESGHRK